MSAISMNSFLLVPLVLLMLAAVITPATAADSDRSPKSERTLGVLIFPGFELLDAYGPLEMWGRIGKEVKVVIIASEPGEVASAQGPKTVADFGFDDCPKLDLILVPGGIGALKAIGDQATLDWIVKRSAGAEILMSVCNGASILAAAGLLDGRKATTNKAYWNLATAPGDSIKWIKKARWVDDGNIVTSSGVSAGMDMSLHVISRLYGDDTATNLANMTEYEWHRDPTWDPFAKLHGLTDE